MDLHLLSDSDLLKGVDKLVREERERLVAILHHLREIERRRLFSALKYTSLFDYAVRRLGYSEDQAARRISAMRLLEEFPIIEQKISTGALTLTHLGMARRAFRSEEKVAPHSPEKKLEILEQLENTSKRDAERLLAANTHATPQENIRHIGVYGDEELVELRFTVTQSTLEKIETLRGLMVHVKPGISLSDLLDHLVEKELGRQPHAAAEAEPRKPSRAAIKREVWRKAGAKCENCGSNRALEVDHILPRGKGGGNDPGNLRLLCRYCNQRAAILEYGLEKMDEHLRRRKRRPPLTPNVT